ncbi:EAL domain-containing protein [Nocardioides sp. Iso805N]|uniref:EAL domain-containing protein n=1 Tax=Nocardioides sp. Iso805N TaxID=1283287 RepID=UPI000375E812|nr:EAL domain-containing protein [Nocardioides sp. Iso805N]
MAALGGAWAGCLAIGGSHSAGTHLFYVAIVLAAVRFTWRATAVVAVAAGVLGGPLLPADVSLGIAQQPDAWIPRLGIFLMIGVLIALLVENPEATLRSRLLDAMASARLLRALKRGEIEVFYQPICRVQDDRITGLEALARWRGSAGGYVSPGIFIPPAERTGAIAHLDEYVLRRAIAAARGWQSGAQPLYVSVNLSATTLAQPRLVAMIDRILGDAGLPPHLLQLEVTESAAIDDLPGAVRQLEALRARGVKVAIDDFGAGQASVSYLQNLPVDVVKIDRCIVSAATSDDRSRRLLEGVAHMCDLLGLQVIAEGVELAEQLTCLREIGVPMAQGFLLGRPAPAGEIHALLDVSALR